MLSLYRKGTRFISIIIFSVVGMVSYAWRLLHGQHLFWGNAFAHGELKYHIKFNTFFPIVALPIVYFAVMELWVREWLSSYLYIVKDWLLKDIAPAIVMTLIYVITIKFVGLNFDILFVVLVALGCVLLVFNTLMYKDK